MDNDKILTVGDLTKLLPPDTAIYFKDLGAVDRNTYVAAHPTSLTWKLGDGAVYLEPGN